MKMKPSETPLPDRMRQLPRDRRGYPVFFGAFIEADGTPHFTINDERKRVEMVRRDLCSICGQKLLRGRWFIGGSRSAFDPKGAYLDMPMHDECAHYALKVCPYLAAPSYAREIADRKAEAIKTGIVLVDETMIPGRPVVFVAVMAVGQRYVGDRFSGGQYVKPARPYRKVEYWQHGRQLTEQEGKAAIAGGGVTPYDDIAQSAPARGTP
jgi:hypothetical protein